MQRLIHRIALTTLFLAAPAPAIQPSHWNHTSEADFRAGQLENVVATNLGDLMLAREIRSIVQDQPRISAVYSIVQTDNGDLYAGTGPDGLLLRIRDGQAQTVLELGNGVSIFSLLADGDALLIGASGQQGRVLRLADPANATVDTQPEERFTAEGMQYVWAMVRTPDGNVYVATGPEGQLVELHPDGGSRLVLQTDEANFLSLISDGEDTLYVGTDPNGLVYRVNRKTGEMFVLYDAAESEISALALDAAGNLFAGTAEAQTGAAGGVGPAAARAIGRPEGEPTGQPIPAQPPEEPAPPELPDPNPSEPDPIPTDPEARSPISDLFFAISDLRSQISDSSVSFMPRLSLISVLQADSEAPQPQEPEAAPEPATGRPPSDQPAARATMPAPARSEPRAEGNAIYRIDPQGFVAEIYRGPVLVLSMIEQDGGLLVGTGSDGLVFQIRPDAEETIVLGDVEAQQVLCLHTGKDGRTYMGLANTGGIVSMSRGFAAEGSYISPVLDASQVARFGKVHLEGRLPQGTSIQVSTRSGNLQEPGAQGWSGWSAPRDAIRYMSIESPAARFLQYRLIFTSDAGQNSPVVNDVDVAYQIPNLPPRISSVTITRSAEEGKQPSHAITWQSLDPNGDELLYELSFRPGTIGPWIALAEDLKEASHTWQSAKIADGRYQIRVTASDAAANPIGEGKTASRVSETILVDNTPPIIGDLTWERQPDAVRVNLRVVDRSSTVAGVAYSVNASDDWQAVLPSDRMFDSPAETASFVIPDLTPGQHQVSIRATDAQGNRSFENLLVTVDQPAK